MSMMKALKKQKRTKEVKSFCPDYCFDFDSLRT